MTLSTMLPAKNTPKKARIEALEARLKYVWADDTFRDQSMHDHILGDMPEIAEYERARRKLKMPERVKRKGFPACGYVEPLLSKEQERHLFRQYNFLKWRIQKIISRSKATHLDLDVADDILIRADQVREQIVLCNVRLGIKFVNSKYRDSGFAQDLVSESFIVIQRAVDCFDWRLNNKFSTYLMRSFHNTVNQAYDRMLKHQDLQIYNKSGSSNLAFLPDKDDAFVRFEAASAVETLMEPLSDREKSILKERFFERRTLEDIGNENGISKERIRQIIQFSFDKIHDWLGDEVVELYRESTF